MEPTASQVNQGNKDLQVCYEFLLLYESNFRQLIIQEFSKRCTGTFGMDMSAQYFIEIGRILNAHIILIGHLDFVF